METGLNYYGWEVIRPEGTATKEYRLPPTFARDHWERACGVDDVIISASSRAYVVEMDVAGYRDMLSDAEYYWECRSEMQMPGLTKSAKRVLEILVAVGPPAGYTVERVGHDYRVNPAAEEAAR